MYFHFFKLDYGDVYMDKLRDQQGLGDLQHSDTFMYDLNQDNIDVFDVCTEDLLDDGSAISAHQLMVSILSADFKISQQADEHLVGSVRKAPTKFPRLCALLFLLEIVSEIASKLLKFIVFQDGNFSRPNTTSNKFISQDFVMMARHLVKEFLQGLPVVANRFIIYIDKGQVERAFALYTYTETTAKIMFNVSNISHLSNKNLDNNTNNKLTRR